MIVTMLQLFNKAFFIYQHKEFSMKNTIKLFGVIAFIAVIGFSATACLGQSGGKVVKSPEELKAYLDSQPANTPENPIKITMSANEQMLPEIRTILNDTGKYVSLNISGKVLTTIPGRAFEDCTSLASVTIPNSVTSIEDGAFRNCSNLASVTIPNT